jgi:hypothetical protein
MNPITVEDKFETVGPSALVCQYRQRFNLWICSDLATVGHKRTAAWKELFYPKKRTTAASSSIWNGWASAKAVVTVLSGVWRTKDLTQTVCRRLPYCRLLERHRRIASCQRVHLSIQLEFGVQTCSVQ